VEFTNLQIKRFYETVGMLQEKGHDVGKLHIQSTYGLCNYHELQCDYARVGIMLYGVMSDNSAIKVEPLLRPVLSLHAKIIQVRNIEAGESVSYGRIYTTTKPTKVAVVSIGYADGVPRQISGNGGFCIVNGVKVPIIGRICMDFLMIDVTAVDVVAPGDVATIIGKNGSEQIRCEDLAEASQTISNDVLCSLSKRLKRVYV
jgi:serine/alanine racemase